MFFMFFTVEIATPARLFASFVADFLMKTESARVLDPFRFLPFRPESVSEACVSAREFLGI